MKTLSIKHSKKKVFDAIKKAGSNLELEIEHSDVAKGKLLLYSPGDLLSFGNKVSVKISNRNGKSLLKVASRSAAIIQLFDWGANANLERDLIDEVKEILNQ